MVLKNIYIVSQLHIQTNIFHFHTKKCIKKTWRECGSCIIYIIYNSVFGIMKRKSIGFIYAWTINAIGNIFFCGLNNWLSHKYVFIKPFAFIEIITKSLFIFIMKIWVRKKCWINIIYEFWNIMYTKIYKYIIRFYWILFFNAYDVL